MKKSSRIVLALFVILLIAAAGGALYLRHLLYSPYKTYTETPLLITISPGKSLDSISRELERRGVIRNAWLLKGIFRAKGTQTKVKAGDYVFDRPMNAMDVYEKLLKGEQQYAVLTIPEGTNIFEFESLLKSKEIPDSENYTVLLKSPAVLGELKLIDSSLDSPEGFLFPETYFFTKHDNTGRILVSMIREFRRRFGQPEIDRAKQLGMSVVEVVTLASLIEKETGQGSERALISGVFHNRLKRSMLLQCDPTVIYSLLLDGEYLGYITRSNLRKVSPYNTYVSPGLPPGPICNPGEASLRAALYPEETDKLYFVSKNDGSHHFSATLDEHNRAVQKYQR